MSIDEAKELLIEQMNAAAYRETDHSLWDSDKNRLFGSEHYKSGRWEAQPSTWGDGEEWERRMAELVRWATWLDSSARLRQAIRVCHSGDQALARIIDAADLTDV